MRVITRNKIQICRSKQYFLRQSSVASSLKSISSLPLYHLHGDGGARSGHDGNHSARLYHAATAALVAGMTAGVVCSSSPQMTHLEPKSSSEPSTIATSVFKESQPTNNLSLKVAESNGNRNLASSRGDESTPVDDDGTSSSESSNFATSSVQSQLEMYHHSRVIDELARSLAELHQRQNILQGRVLHSLSHLAEEASLNIKGKYSTTNMIKVNDGSSAINESFISIPKELTDLSPTEAWRIIQEIQEKHVFENDEYYTDADQRHKNKISRSDLKKIFNTAAQLLRSEPTVNELRNREDLNMITVVGDLHGQYDSLMDVLQSVGRTGFGPKPPEEKGSDGKGEKLGSGTPWDGTGAIVFNGDFVDRGEDSLGVLISILLLKVAFPNNVYLNRGNHEDDLLSTVYGFTEELESLYATKENKSIDDIWEAIGDVFAALPLCVCTPTAVIMHGGLPSEDFSLDQLRSITPERRSELRSIIESNGCKLVELFQSIVWSDPKPENGIRPNEARGVGVYFGPDVTRQFLRREGFEYFIRSHQPVDMGYETIESNGESSGAVTVFSAAQFPVGLGFNWGAVVQLNRDSGFIPEPVFFQGRRHHSHDLDFVDKNEKTMNELSQVIARNSYQLMSSFHDMAIANGHSSTDDVLVTPYQWALVMSQKLDLPNVDWRNLQSYLVPSTKKASADNDVEYIDCKHFLSLHCNISYELEDSSLKHLQQHQRMLINVFRFLDTDQSGQIDMNEFRVGIEMINRHTDQDVIHDPDVLFKSIDKDGSGLIDIDEFTSAFSTMSTPYHISCFKKFDFDDSGTIDRKEFVSVLKTMNEGLPSNRQLNLDKADIIFDKSDVDSNGELDIVEFKRFLEYIGYLPKQLKLEKNDHIQ